MTFTEFDASVLETLLRARWMISERQNWTSDADARDASGRPVFSNHIAACRFSMGAAVIRAGLDLQNGCLEALDVLQAKSYWSLQEFNDSHSHTEVLEFMDKRISELRNQGWTP